MSVISGGHGSLSVLDELSGRVFLVDTGADVSVFPASATDKNSSPQGNLVAANGTVIKTFGHRNIKVKFLTVSVLHSFRVADVNRLILGADFFARTGLLVDVKGRQLVRLPRLQSPLVVVPATVSQSRGIHATVFGLHDPRSNQVEALLDDFPDVLVSKYDSAPPLHGVEHVVPTSGPPVYARARPLAGEKLSVAKAEFQKMLDMGIVCFVCLFVCLERSPSSKEGMGGVLFMRSQFPTPRAR